MRKVIAIPNEEEQSKIVVPIELTHRKTNGWVKLTKLSESIVKRDCDKIVHLGSCNEDGDMFAVYIHGYIRIYKGELNSGVY